MKGSLELRFIYAGKVRRQFLRLPTLLEFFLATGLALTFGIGWLLFAENDSAQLRRKDSVDVLNHELSARRAQLKRFYNVEKELLESIFPDDAVVPSPLQFYLNAGEDALVHFGASMRAIPHSHPLGIPLQINSHFGHRRAVFFERSGQTEFHPGVDLYAPMATTVLAAAEGLVLEAAQGKTGYGNFVRLEHPSGFESLYGHLSYVAVKRGEFVSAKALLGRSGNSGYSNGPHLHYEIRLSGRPVNAEDFLPTD